MRYFWILLLLIYLPVSGAARIFPIWKVRNFSVNEGLTQNTVYCIFQDRRGYIWAGTGGGLNLLNGHTIVPFRNEPGDSCSLIQNAVRGILEDTEGNLLVGTEGGLSILKNRTCFYSPEILKNKAVIPLEIKSHSVLLWLQCGGLFWFDIRNEHLTPVDPEFNAFCKKNCVGLFTSTVIPGAGRILRTNFRDYRVDHALGKVLPYALDTETAVFLDSKNRQWQVNPQGLYRIFPGNQKVFQCPNPGGLGNLMIKGCADADSATLLFGTYKEGIWMYSPEYHALQPVIREGINFTNRPSDLITCLFRDLSGNIWIGTDGNGLELYRPEENLFVHVHSIPWTDLNLGSEFSRAFHFMDPQTLLIACFNSPLQAFDLRTYRPIPLKILSDPAFKGMNITSLGGEGKNVLIASEDGLYQGVLRYTGSGIILESIRQMSSQVSRYVTKTGTEDWVVNVGGEMWKLKRDPGGFRKVSTMQTWQWTHFSSLNPAVSGGPLILNFNKIILMARPPFSGKPDSTHLFHLPREVTKIYQTLSRPPDQIITASNYGIFFHSRDGRMIRHLSTNNGLTNNYVYSLIPDRLQRLWCSSNNGIMCVDTRDNRVIQYSMMNGIQSPEFNSGAWAEGPDGLVVMGGIRGFNLFYPNNIGLTEVHTKLVLSGLSLNDDAMNPDYIGIGENHTFSHYLNNFWFEVSCTDYSHPASHEYAFLLEGYDEEWIYTGTHNSIRYQHLPPGSYRLKVRTGHLHNGYGPPIMLYHFRILKPVYQRWWFLLLVTLTGLAVIMLVLRIYLRNKYLQRIHALEKEQAVQGERLRISKDMHDDIGTGISQIAILSEIAKKTAHIPETGTSVLEKISKVAGELIDNISNMIWITKPEYDNLESLVSYLREYAGSLFENTGIALRFELPPDLPPIPVHHQLRRNIFLVYKEALNNILKHANATALRIHFELTDTEFTIMVKDNGVGFDPEKERKSGGDGLGNMQKRLEDCHGRFVMESAPGKGCRIFMHCRLQNHPK